MVLDKNTMCGHFVKYEHLLPLCKLILNIFTGDFDFGRLTILQGHDTLSGCKQTTAQRMNFKLTPLQSSCPELSSH